MKYQYFISSRWRNKSQIEELTKKIREKGKTVYSFIEGDGSTPKLKDLNPDHDPEVFMKAFENIPNWVNDPRLKEIFDIDMNALRASDIFILLLPAGKSAHIESGAAFGMGKRCIVIGEQNETESLYLIFSQFYKNIDDFIESLK